MFRRSAAVISVALLAVGPVLASCGGSSSAEKPESSRVPSTVADTTPIAGAEDDNAGDTAGENAGDNAGGSGAPSDADAGTGSTEGTASSPGDTSGTRDTGDGASDATDDAGPVVPHGSDIACGTLAPLSSSARVLSTMPVDWAGTGQGAGGTATVSVYETGAGSRDYRVRVEEGPGGPAAGTGSEFAIIMSPDATPGSEPSVVGTAQTDLSIGAGTGLSEEILVEVGDLAADASGSTGFGVAIFYKDSTGCLARYQNADFVDLVLPIRTGGSKVSGLACEGTARSGFLVHTSASRKSGSMGTKGYYAAKDIRLALAVDADGAPILPAQLVDSSTGSATIRDTRTATSPLLKYNSVYGCAHGAAD